MAPRFWLIAVSVITRGGLCRFARAAVMTFGISAIRAMPLATFVSSGSVDCVSSR